MDTEQVPDEGQHQWNRLGLGAASLQVHYEDQERAIDDVLFLMSHGHGHHFAVINKQRTVVMSQLAVDCLIDRDQEQARGEDARRQAQE